MSRFLLLFALLSLPSLAQVGEPDPILGRVEGNTYISPTGAFRVAIPVLPELGGRILDTDSTVTFQDDFNVLCTIAAVPMDATQRWEFSTRGAKDYLPYFFANFVLPDFRQAFPATTVESAKYAATVADGALFAYTLLPGGSMFAHKLAFAGADRSAVEAKRGNLLFVRNNVVFVLSTELAERVTERSTYKKTAVEEDDLLRQRLVDLLGRIQFTKPEVTPTK